MTRMLSSAPIRLLLFFFFLSLVACTQPQPKLEPLVKGDVILAFGDSLTFGTGAAAGASYPDDLQAMTGLKVINAGVPGEMTAQGLARILDVMGDARPNLVILCLGANDLLNHVPLEQIKDNLRKMITIIEANGAQVVLIAAPTLTNDLKVPDLYAELGEEMRVPVDTAIIAKLERVSEYKSDLIHFNNSGYRQFAQEILDFMKQVGVFTANQS